MKKVISGCLTFLFCMSFVQNVMAASTCDYSEQVELQNVAANVKATYEANVRQTDEFADIDSINDPNGAYIVENYVDITVLNITEQIYVTVQKGNSTEVKTYHYGDTSNGTLRFSKDNLDEIVEYKILIYSDHDHCRGDLLRTISLLTPKYNEYSEYGFCDALSNLFYCQQFITTEITTDAVEIEKEMLRQYQLFQKQEEEQQHEELGFWKKVMNFLQDHVLIIGIVLTVIIIVGVSATVIVVKKRRSRVL